MSTYSGHFVCAIAFVTGGIQVEVIPLYKYITWLDRIEKDQ